MPQERGTETDATQDTEFSVVWHSITKPLAKGLAGLVMLARVCRRRGKRGLGQTRPPSPRAPYQGGPRWTPSSALYRSTYSSSAVPPGPDGGPGSGFGGSSEWIRDDRTADGESQRPAKPSRPSPIIPVYSMVLLWWLRLPPPVIISYFRILAVFPRLARRNLALPSLSPDQHRILSIIPPQPDLLAHSSSSSSSSLILILHALFALPFSSRPVSSCNTSIPASSSSLLPPSPSAFFPDAQSRPPSTTFFPAASSIDRPRRLTTSTTTTRKPATAPLRHPPPRRTLLFCALLSLVGLLLSTRLVIPYRSVGRHPQAPLSKGGPRPSATSHSR